MPRPVARATAATAAERPVPPPTTPTPTQQRRCAPRAGQLTRLAQQLAAAGLPPAWEPATHALLPRGPGPLPPLARLAALREGGPTQGLAAAAPPSPWQVRRPGCDVRQVRCPSGAAAGNAVGEAAVVGARDAGGEAAAVGARVAVGEAAAAGARGAVGESRQPSCALSAPAVPFGTLLAQPTLRAVTVLHRGDAVLEHYAAGMRPHHRHALADITGGLVVAVAQALCADPDVPLTLATPAGAVIPALRGGAYAEVPLARLLDGASGVVAVPARPWLRELGRGHHRAALVRGAEDAAAARSCAADAAHGADAGAAAVGGPAGHGTHRNDLEVAAWMCEASSGEPLARLTADCLWQPLGCADAADWAVDGDGAPIASIGMASTLRDLARFGQHVLHGSAGADAWRPGALALPAWAAQASPAARPLPAGHALPPRGALYRAGAWRLGHRTIYCGAHGQLLYIDPTQQLVAVLFAARGDGDPQRADHAAIWCAAFAAVGAALEAADCVRAAK